MIDNFNISPEPPEIDLVEYLRELADRMVEFARQPRPPSPDFVFHFRDQAEIDAYVEHHAPWLKDAQSQRGCQCSECRDTRGEDASQCCAAKQMERDG